MPLFFLSVCLIFGFLIFLFKTLWLFPSKFHSIVILNLCDWFFFFSQSESRWGRTLLWGIACSRRFWLVLLSMAFTWCILLTFLISLIIAHIIVNLNSWILRFQLFLCLFVVDLHPLFLVVYLLVWELLWFAPSRIVFWLHYCGTELFRRKGDLAKVMLDIQINVKLEINVVQVQKY